MNTEKFNNFLSQLSNLPISVIKTSALKDLLKPIDLSAKNKELLKFDTAISSDWETYIATFLEDHKATIAFGGYLEKRNLYDRSSYFKNVSEKEKRNIHLGVDLWCKENSKVLAVLDGKVHSFKNNLNYGDYGPTIILEHEIEGEIFYSLYGHLTLKSIRNLKIGQSFLQGNEIGAIGNASVNGDYAPHLHFQLIRNLENCFGDYPGVSSEEKKEFYVNNCPDPNLLLKLY